MRLWSALLLIFQIARATNRVVVTFDTMELATRPYDIANATMVKQYGRRMVLDLGREAVLPEAWLGESFGVNVTVELDALVMVRQADYNESDDDDFWDEAETTTEEPPETTSVPAVTLSAANFTPGVVAQNYDFSNTPSISWNLADSEPFSIHVEGTWKITNSTPDVFVAVLDTGLAQVARGSFLNLAQGYDFVSDESISLDGDGRDVNPTDPGDGGPDCPNPSWHGTKVMSILAADHRNAFGVLGVAQNASIIPIRVLGQCSMGYANDITDAIVWAAGGTIKGVDKNPNPAKIISMSFAGGGLCPSYMQSAINQAVGLGAFLIAAAGNEGLESTINTFPANCQNVLSVGASTRRGKLAAYSNKGADIAAPGGDGSDPIHVLSVRNGVLSDSYSMGTSMAAPHVAGVASLHILREANFSRWTFLERHSSGRADNDSSKIPIVRSKSVPAQWTRCDYGWCEPGYSYPYCAAGSCSPCDSGTYNPKYGLNWPMYITLQNHPYGEVEYQMHLEYYPAYGRAGVYIWYDYEWRYSQTGFGEGYAYSDYHLTVFANIFTNDDIFCIKAPPGTFVSGQAASSYTNCPANSNSPIASTSISQCTCNTGYYGSSGSCTACPANSKSEIGSTVITQCICNSGYYRADNTCPMCSASCIAGKYKTANCATAADITCPNCPANSNSPAGSTSIAQCTCNARFYGSSGSCTTCPANSNSVSGTTSIAQCTCNSGYYRTGDTCAACSASCAAGKYKTANCATAADITCPNCPANSNSPDGSTSIAQCTCNLGYYDSSGSCTICSAGKFAATRGQTVCTSCTAGIYAATTGLSTCVACSTGTCGTGNGFTSCTTCAIGTYAPTTGLTVCTSCAAGKYAYTTGLSTCADCTSGSTYTSSIQSTTCLSCTVCDGNAKYQYSACNPTSNTVCCNNIISAGTYANSCEGTSSCPALRNGNYINSGSTPLNRCMDFTCNAGYYASPAELAKAGTLCQSSNYVMSASCAPYVNTVCNPATTCANGVSTVLRTPSGSAILNSTINDIQCTKCVSCMPGTVQISACTDSTQTVCAVCSATGLYAGYPLNGRCMYYSTTPGTMTLSQTPIGFFPYILSYSSAVLAAIANNSISYPTKKVTEFTLDPLTYSMTTIALSAGFSVSHNIFIPCATPPLGRRFKAWSGLQAKGATVTCTSITGCANFQAPCDLASSTECTGWNNALKQGWYASAPGVCTLCPNISSYSTCNWGFYRNLSDCRPDRVADCFPCHGTLPPNAVWTTSKSPHYFDDSEPSPCNWDCDKGFYKEGATCTACNKPENSEFGYGPFIIYDTIPPPMTCLDAATCKYFGGILGYGCLWRCPDGFKTDILQNGQPICVLCPVLSCKSDEIVVFVDTCNQCQKCNNIVANAVYQSGCTFTCAEGYYLLRSDYCAPCSVNSCPAGQYSGGCGDVSDSTCLSCTQCAVGYSVSTSCSTTADAVCSPCTADLIPYSTYDSDCNVVCRTGYVMSTGGSCLPCAVSDSSCFTGQRKSATCTALNLGCDACVAPTTNNWCWSGGAVCTWDCGPGYRKLSGVCVADVSKTTNPCVSDVFVLTTSPPVTTLPLTTLPPVIVPSPDTSSTLTTLPPVIVPYTSSTVTSQEVTTPRATTRPATTPRATTPNSTTRPSTTPLATPDSTPVTRETLTVANLTISQCLCSSSQVAAQLSVLYQTTVLVVSCANDASTVECTNYVCPCTGNRRRLLQLDVTKYIVAFKRSVEKPAIASSAITKAIQTVIPTAVVTETASEILSTTTLTWTSVTSTPGDPTGLVVVAFFFVLAVCAGYAWSRTRPVKARIINLPIDKP